jgi:flagellar basal-body rod protein FlgG
MNGQQFNIDTIANNLANVNTTGFKKSRADFEDLMYQTLKVAGTPATDETVVPTGIQVGLGVKTAATQRMFDQGSLQQTGNTLDLALVGQGFFKVQMQDGTEAFTRDGSFKLDENGQVVNSNGLRLVPDIVFPDDIIKSSITINELGIVTAKDPANQTIEIGRITVNRFINPAVLSSIGGNLYKVTEASGQAIEGTPGLNGQPLLKQKFIEMSNVKVVDEMVNMITAQRAYEFNSKAITTSDNMLQTAVNLKR